MNAIARMLVVLGIAFGLTVIQPVVTAEFKQAVFELAVWEDAKSEFDTLFDQANARVIREAKAEFDAIYATQEIAVPLTFEVYIQAYDSDLSTDPMHIEFLGEFETEKHAVEFSQTMWITNERVWGSRFSVDCNEMGMVIMDSEGNNWYDAIYAI